MNNNLVSVLHEGARKREGASTSHIVTGRAELTAKLLTTEAWSPTLYDGDRRANLYFSEANWIAFDIDEGMTVEEARRRFRPFWHVIGTTSSHQAAKGTKPPCDRFRLLLKLREPITSADDYKFTLTAVAEMLGIPLDPAAKDAARWFLPCKEIASFRPEGTLITPFKAELKAPQGSSLRLSPPATTSAPGERGKLSRATRDFLAQEPSTDGWHTRFIKAAMDFKEQGYTEAEAEQRLATASPVFELDDTDLKQLADVYMNRGGALDFRPAWPDMLPPTKTQPAKPAPSSIANQRYLLTEVLGYKFQANTRREVVYYTERDRVERKLLTDTVLAKLNTAAREHGLSAGESLRDLVITMAQEGEFDPILEPLNALTWDGGQHIAKLFETIKLPANTTPEARDWYALFLRRWLIGVVTKVFKPGSENNVLVFQGSQAAGKSRWLKRLAELWPEGFGEGHISPDDKDHELRHLDNFIWHVAEFDSTTSRREVGALKDYFTKDTVNVRRPYSKFPIVGRSICSFCASVNSHEFLHDATGNRRYLVIPVEGVDADHPVNIPQVFAEAKAAFENEERQWFTREEISEVNKLNESFLSKEEYLEHLEAYAVPGVEGYSLSELMDKAGFPDIQLTRPIRSNIRTILERNGIRQSRERGTTKYFVDVARLKGESSGSDGGGSQPTTTPQERAAKLALAMINKN